MSLRSRILLSIAALLIIVGGYFAFSYLRRIKAPVADPLLVIPKSSVCVMGTKDARNLWQQLNQGNLIWDALNETEWAATISETASSLDSLFNSDPEVNALLDDRQCWMSLNYLQKDKLNYVFSISLPNVTASDKVVAFLKKIPAPATVNEKDYKTASLYEISGGTRKFSVCIDKGVVSVSDDEELLKAGDDQLNKQHSLLNDSSFVRVLNTSNETSAARILINYSALSAPLRDLSQREASIPDFVSTLGSWGEFDMNLHPNSVFLNGYTAYPDSSAGFISEFSSQSDQPVMAPEILPASTVSYVSFALSNFAGFITDREKYLASSGEMDDYKRETQRLKNECNFSSSESFGSWIGNEFAQAIVAFPGNGTETFALISMADEQLAKEKLSALGADSTILSPDSSGYVIHRFPAHAALSNVFGGLFSALDESYYTFIDEFVVFGQSSNALRSFITYYGNKATLDHNSTYADFKTNLSETANITAYISPGHSIASLATQFSDAFMQDIRAHDKLIKRFDGCVYQVTNNDELYYTSIFIRHNPQGKKSMATLWELPLDTTFSGKPFLVRNHKTKGLDIFLQDDGNTIYLISSTGTIFWKRKLDEPIIGDVTQVDALKNGKLQLAFNTASSIYIIDRNGNDLEHFPVKLPARATNPVYVLDYDNNREYRMLVACADKKIYNYNIKGSKVDGWKIYSTKDSVNAVLKRIIVSNKDYVIAVDHSGNSYFTDRQGNTRISLSQHLAAPVERFFIETGKDPAHTFLVSSDTLGNVSKLSMMDQLERLHFSDFQTRPDFFDQDINGDGSPEYVFLSGEHFTIFNSDKKPIIDKIFTETLYPEMVPVFFDTKDIRFALMAPASNELHLINKGGEDSDGFPLNGGTLFAIGKFGAIEGYTLICGNNGHYVEAFPLP